MQYSVVNLTSINVFEVFDKSNFCVNCVHFVSYCHLRSWSWSWHCRSWLQVWLYHAGMHCSRQAENQHFRPAGATRCTDSCEIWHSRAARGSDGPREFSAVSVHVGAYATPKSGKFPLFWQRLARRGEPLDRFLQGTLCVQLPSKSVLNFNTIHFTDYGVIAKTPRVYHLRGIFRCTL